MLPELGWYLALFNSAWRLLSFLKLEKTKQTCLSLLVCYVLMFGRFRFCFGEVRAIRSGTARSGPEIKKRDSTGVI